MLIHLIHMLSVILLFQSTLGGEKLLKRAKRHLVFPQSGTFKLVIGIAIPVKLGIKQSMACGLNFQFQYGLPTNITQLERPYPPIIGKSRERRAQLIQSERALFYLGVESALNRHGVNGRACVLRSICDNAMHSLNHEANGLYGQLLHIAMTPISQHDDVDSDLYPTYTDAQKAGEFGVDCISLYPDCPEGAGIMDTMSILDT